MRIRIFNKGRRNQLVCERRNKNDDVADLGPNTPFHDIAHFIVERQLKLTNGFYGNIYSGYSVAELSDKNIIKTLPPESILAEVAARALQSLGSGACTVETFSEMILSELIQYGIPFPYQLDQNEVAEMHREYQDQVLKWQTVQEGEVLEMNLNVEEWLQV